VFSKSLLCRDSRVLSSYGAETEQLINPEYRFRIEFEESSSD